MFRFLIICALFAASIGAQKIALIEPAGASESEFAQRLRDQLSARVSIIDASLASAAFRALKVENALNLTTTQSRNIAAAIGCDFFAILGPGSQRRAVSGGNPVYEAYVTIHLVSSRTGALVHFEIVSAKETTAAAAANKLLGEADRTADTLFSAMADANRREVARSPVARIEEVPDVGSPAAKDLKPPLPYRRIKPEYTATATLYGVTATVEISADLDDEGKITRTEVTRWAGFGLDDSVERAVRSMNWRPAYRSSKPLPMRILLRYNFKRLDTAN